MSLTVLACNFREHNWNHRRLTDLSICLHLTDKGNITDMKQFLDGFYIKRLVGNFFSKKKKAPEQVYIFCKVSRNSTETSNHLTTSIFLIVLGFMKSPHWMNSSAAFYLSHGDSSCSLISASLLRVCLTGEASVRIWKVRVFFLQFCNLNNVFICLVTDQLHVHFQNNGSM